MILAETIGLFAALVSILCVTAAAMHTEKPVHHALVSALCGVAVLGAVNFMAGYTGVAIAFNYATAFAAVVLGAPGVITMLLLRMILLC